MRKNSVKVILEDNGIPEIKINHFSSKQAQRFLIWNFRKYFEMHNGVFFSNDELSKIRKILFESDYTPVEKFNLIRNPFKILNDYELNIIGDNNKFQHVEYENNVYVLINGVPIFKFNFNNKSKDNAFFSLVQFSISSRDILEEFLSKNFLMGLIFKSQFIFENKVITLRDYQFNAIDKLLKQFDEGKNGYAFHYSKSGNSLSSYKLSRCFEAIPDVDKIVFVISKDDELFSGTEFLSKKTKDFFKDFSNNKWIMVHDTILNHAIHYKESVLDNYSGKVVFVMDDCTLINNSFFIKRLNDMFVDSYFYGFISPSNADKFKDYKLIRNNFNYKVSEYLSKNKNKEKNTFFNNDVCIEMSNDMSRGISIDKKNDVCIEMSNDMSRGISIDKKDSVNLLNNISNDLVLHYIELFEGNKRKYKLNSSDIDFFSKKSGVYLICYEDEVIYVGQSKNLKNRLRTHCNANIYGLLEKIKNENGSCNRSKSLAFYMFIEEHKNDIYFKVIECSASILDEVEQKNIEFYKPKYNYKGVLVPF